MMTIEAWIAFAAAATALLLVPHPLAFSVVAYTRSRGRMSALLTVAASTVSISLAAALAVVATYGLFTVMPAIGDAASWLGIAFVVVYILFALRSPRLRQGIADNDNLPATGQFKVFCHFLGTVFSSGRYVFLAAAILAQYSDRQMTDPDAYAISIAVFAASAALSTLAYALFPRLLTWKSRRPKASGKASHKPRTLFIARRAVTAGYRRIAA